MSEYVKVPKSRLQALEEARLEIHKLLGKMGGKISEYDYLDFLPSTGVMWVIANTKWEEVDD